MFGVFFGLEIDLILKECSILESTFEWFVHTEFYCSLFFIMWLLKSLLLDVNHIEMSFSFNNVFSLSIHSECVHECCAGDLVNIETGFREWFSIISQLNTMWLSDTAWSLCEATNLWPSMINVPTNWTIDENGKSTKLNKSRSSFQIENTIEKRKQIPLQIPCWRVLSVQNDHYSCDKILKLNVCKVSGEEAGAKLME